MFKFLLLFILVAPSAYAVSEAETRKTHLEDIFIWKMSDELKLSAQEEKSFTEINKSLNRRKSDLNKKIQEYTLSLDENSPEATLKEYRKLLEEYNHLSVQEFDSIKKLLGSKRFVSYLKIKNELTIKMKSILIGDKTGEKHEPPAKALPPPKVVVEQDN